MKILLDTNILIQREWNNIKHSWIWELFFYLDKLKHEKWITQLSVKELETYKDKKVVDLILTKIQNYNISTTFFKDLEPSLEKLSNKLDKNQNDKIDTLLLNEVIKWKFDIMITEDKLIYEKAKQLCIEDKIFNIDAFLEKVYIENPKLVDYKVLSIKKEKFWNINLDDVFFNTLKADYNWFEKWFHKKSEEEAYTYINSKWEENNQIGWFLYIKEEGFDDDYSNISPKFDKKKRLKIGTFKVTANWFKLWERFMKIIVDNAILRNVDEIYVTIFDRTEWQKRLIELFEQFWFQKHGIKDWEELVYTKELKLKTINIENPILTYPYISRNCNIFLVPIKEDYHTELFPDSILKNESPENLAIDMPYQNSIRKTYISHSYWEARNKLKSWDLLVFYRNWWFHRWVITTICIVENKIWNIKSAEELIKLCKRKTLFTEKKLNELWNKFEKLKPFLINFLYIDSIKSKINLNKMLEVWIVNSFDDLKKWPYRLTTEKFNKIIDIWHGNKSIIID